MLIMLILGLILAALFIVWKVQYGFPPPEVPQVLCYHKLSDRFCFEGTWIQPKRFLKQIDELRQDGFEFIDVDRFLSTLDHPHEGSGREILLTFDDGYRALHDIYIHELAPRGVPVVVFMPADYIGCKNAWDLSFGRRAFSHLSAREISDMVARGAHFGSHGASHRDLTRLAPAALDYEIDVSKRAIETVTGSPVRLFSYPFGRYNADVKARVEASGYEAAFSLYPRHANAHIDRFALRRNGVYVIDTHATVRIRLTRHPLFWFEEMKCRTINRIAVLTPVLKRLSAGRDK